MTSTSQSTSPALWLAVTEAPCNQFTSNQACVDQDQSSLSWSRSTKPGLSVRINKVDININLAQGSGKEL